MKDQYFCIIISEKTLTNNVTIMKSQIYSLQNKKNMVY